MELTTLKDLITIITGSIGACLGIAGFVKSIRTEKKVNIEPYFKNVWREISDHIEGIKNDIEYYQYNITFFFKNFNKYSMLEKIEGSGTPNIYPRRVYDITKIDFRYSKKLKRLISKSINDVKRIDALIEQYNRDWYYAHNDFNFDALVDKLLEHIQSVSDKENDKMQNSTNRKQKNQVDIEELEKRLKKYYKTDKIDNLKLRENQKYMNELDGLKQKLISEIKKMHIDKGLIKLKEFYDKKFI
jgi:hypothetical protein